MYCNDTSSLLVISNSLVLMYCRAKEKYGTLENLEKEKAKARLQEDLYLRGKNSTCSLSCYISVLC